MASFIDLLRDIWSKRLREQPQEKNQPNHDDEDDDDEEIMWELDDQ